MGCSTYIFRQITGAAKTTERQFVLHLLQDGGCCQGETSAVPLGARLTNTSKIMGDVCRFVSVPELKLGDSPSDGSEGIAVATVSLHPSVINREQGKRAHRKKI